jgi:hypothetical protein
LGNDASGQTEHIVRPGIAAQTQPTDELAPLRHVQENVPSPQPSAEASPVKPVAAKKRDAADKGDKADKRPVATATASAATKAKPQSATAPVVVENESTVAAPVSEELATAPVEMVASRDGESAPFEHASTSLAAKTEPRDAPAAPSSASPKTAPLTAAIKVSTPALPAVPENARVSIGPIVARSAVSKASVRSALNMDAVTDCYRSALRSGAATAEVSSGEIAITTNMGGAISSASLHAPTLRDTARACIEQVVRRGRVREVDTGAAGASITLLFQPR